MSSRSRSVRRNVAIDRKFGGPLVTKDGVTGSVMAAALDASPQAALRRRLKERRDQLRTSIAAGRRSDQPVSPDKAIGRLTRQDALQQQQMSAELIRRYENELVRVQHALNALEAGTYGLCQRCGDPIAAARLDALPHASLCVRCAERQSGSRR